MPRWSKRTTHPVPRIRDSNGPRPADGSFAVQVFDLHSRGARVRLRPAGRGGELDFTLSCDPDKLNLGPGPGVPLFVQVVRRAGFRGPVTVDWAGLPKG